MTKKSTVLSLFFWLHFLFSLVLSWLVMTCLENALEWGTSANIDEGIGSCWIASQQETSSSKPFFPRGLKCSSCFFFHVGISWRVTDKAFIIIWYFVFALLPYLFSFSYLGSFGCFCGILNELLGDIIGLSSLSFELQLMDVALPLIQQFSFPSLRGFLGLFYELIV